MRHAFHEYFTPSDLEFDDLWTNGLIAFDASALLNIYGYSDKTRKALVSTLDTLKARVRLPYQFGLEFSRNRSNVILKQVGKYRTIIKNLNQIRDVELLPRREHPFLSSKSNTNYQKIIDELQTSQKKLERLVNRDPFLNSVLAAFQDRVGVRPTDAQLQELYQEAKSRYSKSVPPGFEDLKDKSEPDAFGDFIGWRQLIDIAKQENKGVIFVCDDTKPDWWQIEKERTIGPRIELRAEFHRETGQLFHMYTSDRFLESAKQYNVADINSSVIDEVKELIVSQRSTKGPDKPKKEDSLAKPPPALLGFEVPGEKSKGLVAESDEAEKPKG